MLPEFPKLQLDIADQVLRFIAIRKNQMLGGLGTIAGHHVFEGNRNSITRADGGHEVTEMARAGAEVRIPFEMFPTMTLDALLARHEPIAHELAKAQHDHMLKTIDKATAAVGNDIDAQGQPFSADLYLKVLDRLAIDFRPDGVPNIPTLYVGPDLAEKAQAVLTEMQADPVLWKRFEAIIDRKREEWRAREASRELAG